MATAVLATFVHSLSWRHLYQIWTKLGRFLLAQDEGRNEVDGSSVAKIRASFTHLGEATLRRRRGDERRKLRYVVTHTKVTWLHLRNRMQRAGRAAQEAEIVAPEPTH